MTDKPESFDSSIPVLTDVVVPGKPEYARAPSADEAAIEYDAQRIAEQLRGRFTSFLTGDARALIEDPHRDDGKRKDSADRLGRVPIHEPELSLQACHNCPDGIAHERFVCLSKSDPFHLPV